jgi:hypothetical protein
VELSANPLALLTFLSTPAVMTNASCVLLFGTGNRYGRAIDRVHELAAAVRTMTKAPGDEQTLRINQLHAGEQRALLIVRALSCFYTAVASFTASTLICLLGAILHGVGAERWFDEFLFAAFAIGALGVLAIMIGAGVLVKESWFSFRILQQERVFLRQFEHMGNS